MSKREARAYDKEFKLNAIKLCLDRGRSRRQIADELGIPTSTLVEWVQSYTKSGNGISR